uniref:Uncharacterized protein n=1 Tax=viral metagenome TaxID=1070528 RepID=A0A6C0F6U0_9ZZZZ
MSNVNGAVKVDTLHIDPNWTIAAINNTLGFSQNGNLKQVITSNNTHFYDVSSALSEHSINGGLLGQNSYYTTNGSEVSLFLKFRFKLDYSIEELQLSLPGNKAPNSSTVGSIIISWNEGGESYSTSMSKIYINDAKDYIIIQSTLFSRMVALNLDINVKAIITYNLTNIPTIEDDFYL